MKTSIIILLSLILSVTAFGQSVVIDFSSPTDLIEIDTTNSDNIWQIGRPQKSFLNSAYSDDKAILTDTINSYPVNDTSSFILKVPEDILARYSTGFSTGNILISFYTKYEMDSLRDFGRIEFSGDSGDTWHIMGGDYTDTTFMAWISTWNVWSNGKSGWSFNDKSFYTGRSTGWEWQEISLFVCSVAHPRLEDTTSTIIGCHPKSLWLKFDFISDSVPNILDGWAIDDIQIYETAYVGITEVKKIDLRVFPNPTSENVTFSIADNEQTTITLYDFLGQQVLRQTFTNSTTINTEQLSDGVYFYELSKDKGEFKYGKVLKQ